VNRNAILTLLAVVLIPLIGYFIAMYYSKDAVHIPRRYFYDDVVIKESGGKTTTEVAAKLLPILFGTK